MDNLIARNSIRLLGLLLFQVLILNNLQFNVYVNPELYILFILLLPLSISPALCIFLGFLTGLCMDMFDNTGGIHAATTTFVAFLRPTILLLIAPPGGYEDIETPRITEPGFTWFLSYAAILLGLHHLTLFILEIFTFSGFWLTLGRAATSTSIALFLALIYSYLFQRSR